MEAIFFLPSYSKDITHRLSTKKWIVHNFYTKKLDELLDPSNYLYNNHIEGITYCLYLDTNIYQFIINSVKKARPKQVFRDAIALVVHCQISDIQIDPTYPVYEKVNYNHGNLNNCLEDLELFYNINSSDPDELAKYALGFTDSFPVSTEVKINYEKKKAQLMKYERLKEWNSDYLMLMVITDIRHNQTGHPEEKLRTFLTWMIKEYKMSLVTALYAIFLFSKAPLKRMMKFKPSSSPEERKNALWNMTWDIYLMSRFFYNWTEKTENNEFLFASDDKPFCEMLRSGITVQKENDFRHLKPILTNSAYSIIDDYLKTDLSIPDRVYNSEIWGLEYRNNLIDAYENKLLKA
jgi:hypothetical protein